MGIGNVLVRVVLSYYLIYIFSLLFNKNKREATKKHISKINKLRKVPVKTLEEQKQFLDMKYPKSTFKFTWKWFFNFVPKFIVRIFLFIIYIKIFGYILNYFGIVISLWQGIVFAILFPFIMNIILHKLNLRTDSILTYTKWGK